MKVKDLIEKLKEFPEDAVVSTSVPGDDGGLTDKFSVRIVNIDGFLDEADSDEYADDHEFERRVQIKGG